MAGEQSVKIYGTPIQEVEIDGVYHKIEGSGSGGLTEISTQYIRITDLDTGIYKLTYDGDRYIYYNGTSSTDSVSVPSGFNLLSVTKTSSSWVWSFAPNGMFVNPIFSGVAYASSGNYQRNGVVCEVSSQTLYLYSMSAGQYRLTYNGAKTIYYGNSSTLPTTYGNFQGVIHLTINTYISGSTTYKIWHMLNGSSGQYLLSGYTNESGSSSSYRAFNLAGSYLTAHSYRPIQVNGTQILANTASTALNLSNDGNVKFAQVSGGKVKASITGLEVAKLYDFTVYNDSYTWGHLTSDNGYTQLFSLDTANGASIGLAEKNGQLSMQIDGDYYFNEGQEKVIGTNTVYNPEQVICNFNGITGENGDRYVKIYESSDIDASNFGDFHIKGVFGGWSMNEKVMIDAFVSTRGDGRQLFCTKLYNSFNSEQRSIADTRAYLAVGTENDHVVVWLCCGDWGSYHIVEMSCSQGTIFAPNSDDFIVGRPSYSMSSQGTTAYNKVLN